MTLIFQELLRVTGFRKHFGKYQFQNDHNNISFTVHFNGLFLYFRWWKKKVTNTLDLSADIPQTISGWTETLDAVTEIILEKKSQKARKKQAQKICICHWFIKALIVTMEIFILLCMHYTLSLLFPSMLKWLKWDKHIWVFFPYIFFSSVK